MGLLFYLQTSTDMKKRTKTLQVSLLIMILGVLSSCHGKSTYARWELLNNSDHSIDVSVFSNSEIQKSISLDRKGTTWGTEDYKISGSGGDFPPLAEALGSGDSIVVVFDDERYSVYTHGDPSDPNNIFYHGNYAIIVESDILNIHRYTFTNEDYENATPIVD